MKPQSGGDMTMVRARSELMWLIKSHTPMLKKKVYAVKIIIYQKKIELTKVFSFEKFSNHHLIMLNFPEKIQCITCTYIRFKSYSLHLFLAHVHSNSFQAKFNKKSFKVHFPFEIQFHFFVSLSYNTKSNANFLFVCKCIHIRRKKYWIEVNIQHRKALSLVYKAPSCHIRKLHECRMKRLNKML